MPHRKTAQRRYELSNRQLWELWIGPLGDFIEGSRNRSAFLSESEREFAYFVHAGALLTNVGTRSEGWWRYESGNGGRPSGDQSVWLAERGLLTVEEEATLLEWASHAGTGTWDPYAEVAQVIRRRRGALPVPEA